jgi:hypothetical protein
MAEDGKDVNRKWVSFFDQKNPALLAGGRGNWF